MEDHKDFVHTGPGTLAGRYLRTFWQPLCVADELKPGWAKPITVMGEDFTLYRGESGRPYLLAQRCAHRGTQLSLGWVEGECIRCLYHGWKYDGSGHCVEQPGEGRAAFAGKVRIGGYPTEEYLGHILAYLGEGEPPPLPRYPDLEQGVIEAGRYTRACNYFNNVENGVDLFHVAWAHRDAHMEHSLEYEAGGFSVEESEWGVTASVTLRNGNVRTNQLGMPNILHFRSQPVVPGGAWTDVLGWRVPITDDCHQSFNVRVMHATGEEAKRLKERIKREPLKNPGRALELARAVLRGDLRIRDLKGESQGILVNLQDDVTQVGQGIVADRERELLGQTDEGVILLRRIWERELRALAEGRPLKQWGRPASLKAASGA
jgi:5,5'-dehydrodivanillate O-demethylase